MFEIDPTLNVFRMVTYSESVVCFNCISSCAMRCSWYLCVFTMHARYEKWGGRPMFAVSRLSFLSQHQKTPENFRSNMDTITERQ